MALIVLDPVHLKKFVKERGGAVVATAGGPDEDDNFDYTPILEDMKVKMTILDDFIRLAAFNNLKDFEKPK